MTFYPLSRARTDAAPVRDHSVALILFILLALVFAPVFGLHIALATFGPDPAAPAEHGRIAEPFGSSAKLVRG